MSQPPIPLYGSVGTPYTEKVVAALRLKGLDFTLVEPQRPEDLRRWSPETGLLPAIEFDGERTHDSSAILDRLEARFPEPALLSRDPKMAREQRVADLVGMLGDRPYFYSETLSRADVSVYAALFGMYTNRFPGGRRLVARHPTLLAFCDRVHEAIAR
ncbi:MAG TPA: glutathione S-transferase family protein [Myxococcota bacterium]|nr:glutathione S-transferase family protein [Myxococcota bacterium]